MDSHTSPKARRLAESAYTSPYSRAGAPSPHPNTDPYASLRASALATLEAMGYDPTTMVEHGVVWAEDQDPFAHVMHSRYIQIMGTSWHRVMESYDEFLSEEEYSNMIRAKTVIPVVKKYQLDIKRQVKYPDSLISAYRQDQITPEQSHGTTSLFSMKQQAIVAECKGYTVYINVQSGRPVDIRTLGGGWPRVFEAFTIKVERAAALKEKWDKEHPGKRTRNHETKL